MCDFPHMCILNNTSQFQEMPSIKLPGVRWLDNGFAVYAQSCSFSDVMAHRCQRLRVRWLVMLPYAEGLEMLKKKGAEQTPSLSAVLRLYIHPHPPKTLR